MSGRAFGSPSRYIQRKGEFDRLHVHAAPLGRQALVLVDPVVLQRLGDRIKAAFTGLDARFEPFGGECCQEEIERVTALAGGVPLMVGVGGGKTINTAKLAGSLPSAARQGCLPPWWT